jgi:hypothetical protein
MGEILAIVVLVLVLAGLIALIVVDYVKNTPRH